MLKQSETLNGKEKVKLDLYKILRMSILLNTSEVDDLTLTKFKESATSIDNILTEEYNKKIDDLFYTTTTLEDEEERLKKLVGFISDRVEQRKSLLADYKSVTSKELKNLDYIEKSGELDLYEDRLNTIKTYLDSSKLIEISNDDLVYLNDELSKEYKLKQKNEEKNKEFENDLLSKFVNILYEMQLYNEIDINNIDAQIESMGKEIQEAEDQKNTFLTAFDNLKDSGISGDLELEYTSYVENAKRNYYYVKEKAILMKIYKLVADKKTEYGDLFSKRENIRRLLDERLFLMQELNMRSKDILLPLKNLVNEQWQQISAEKSNIDNINILTERIKLKENRLDELEKEVKKPEILSILKEYGLIDTYEHEDIDIEEYLKQDEETDNITEELPKDDIVIKDETPNEEKEPEPLELLDSLVEDLEPSYKPNQIKDCKTVMTMNLGLSRLKSISVMKRVSDMLGINARVDNGVFVEPPKEDELFWTPSELADIKGEKINKQEEKTLEPINNSKEEPLDTIKVNEDDIFLNNDQSNIFETNKDEEIIFPEPIKEEPKQDNNFMWSDNMETFDIDGIFPN